MDQRLLLDGKQIQVKLDRTCGVVSLSRCEMRGSVHQRGGSRRKAHREDLQIG